MSPAGKRHPGGCCPPPPGMSPAGTAPCATWRAAGAASAAAPLCRRSTARARPRGPGRPACTWAVVRTSGLWWTRIPVPDIRTDPCWGSRLQPRDVQTLDCSLRNQRFGSSPELCETQSHHGKMLRTAHLLRTSKTRMAWCEPSALPDSLMITGAGSMPRSMHTSCRAGTRWRGIWAQNAVKHACIQLARQSACDVTALQQCRAGWHALDRGSSAINAHLEGRDDVIGVVLQRVIQRGGGIRCRALHDDRRACAKSLGAHSAA